MPNQPLYRRVLLKLSGEILAGAPSQGSSKREVINTIFCQRVAAAIKLMQGRGMQIGIVIGGGNIFRGIQAQGLGLPRTPADHMGMLSTLINGIALQQALSTDGCSTRLMSALACPQVAESFNWRQANEYLSKGEIVIFVGGTGNPYFTTDTAAALRASEIKADILLKATKVNGIYNKDPLKHPEARKYETISYTQILAEKLEIMDATSIALCMNNQIPILVFDMQMLDPHHIEELLRNQRLGTLVTN